MHGISIVELETFSYASEHGAVKHIPSGIVEPAALYPYDKAAPPLEHPKHALAGE
jgi:hypothetical protein